MHRRPLHQAFHGLFFNKFSKQPNITSRISIFAAIFVTVFVTVFVTACAGDEPTRQDTPASATASHNNPPRARFHNLSSADPSESFDINGDGNNDQFYFRQNGVVTRIERDLNFDSRPDLFEHYEGSQLIEEELDLDFDGQIDAVKFMRDGVVDRRQYAISFKEQLVITSWYDGTGNLIRIERDTNDDDRIDTWEHYNPGESEPHRIEVDYDGDERPDDTLLGDAPAQGG